MNSKLILDWVLMIALIILAKINKWRVSFVHQDSVESLIILRQPHDKVTTFGAEVRMECRTLEETTVFWYHNGVRVNPGLQSNPDSLVTVNVTNRESLLVIRRLTPDLLGRYHCKAFNKDSAIRRGAWVNVSDTGQCPNGVQKEDGGTITNKSGDSFSLPSPVRNPAKVIWTKTLSRNPYKLMFSEPGMSPSSNVQVAPNGELRITSLNILDQGDWSRLILDARGCTKLTKYRINIENSEAEDCGNVKKYVQENDDENINTDAGKTGPKKDPVVSGEVAKNGSAPWFAGLCRKGKANVYCGGTLVGKKWIVTAAHCLFEKNTNREYGEDEITIKLGSHSPVCDIDGDYSVVHIIKHPKQNIVKNDYTHDIALLELDLGPDETSPLIKPSCLERSSFYDQEGVFDPGREGRIVGVGKLDEYDVRGSETLQSLELPIVDDATCRAATRHHLDKHTICAGVPEGGKDACKGDSGGPFTMKLQDRVFLVGVVSWGVGCARPGNYGYYTNVGEYYDWIKDEISQVRPINATEAPEDDYYDYSKL